ncbi:MAG: hypothetical protein IJS88_00660 [Alphaproteobacteria bacterium]|nr:hypothetical protein [Alphaproteobacteria bacterium]
MFRRQEPETNLEKFLEFYDHNYKKLKRLFIFTFVCIFLLLFSRLAFWAVDRYTFNRDLNRTVNQISQLVDNVRTTYAIYTETQTDIMRLMAQSNTMPDFLVQDGKFINVYGGGIVVASSTPIINNNKSFPTFKIAYQGLKKEVCEALSLLDWGDEESGLIAEALGSINEQGIDTALRDIEEEPKEEIVEITLDNGSKKFVKKPAPILFNVAKPNDAMIPTPFTAAQAADACNCGTQRSCSFALRYYTYLR